MRKVIGFHVYTDETEEPEFLLTITAALHWAIHAIEATREQEIPAEFVRLPTGRAGYRMTHAGRSATIFPVFPPIH